MNWHRFASMIVLAVLCLAALPAPCAAESSPAHGRTEPLVAVRPSNNALAARGFNELYNGDYDLAIRDFRELRKQHPEDPFPSNDLLAAVLFKELDRIGALNTEAYSNDSFLHSKVRRPLDPAVRKEIFQLIAQVESQCDARLAKNPDDVDALYARGVARSFRATYMGMAEKSWLAAIRSAMGARRDDERVLELDPSYVDAKLTVGIHNYIIGSLNWPTRMAVALVGVTGSRKKGLEYLREVSRANVTSSTDATMVLALFLRREQRYPEALELVRGLSRRYPRNFLLAVEYGNLLNAAGHGQEAIAQYRLVLERGRAGKYSSFHPERAAWGLGISLRGQREFAPAAEAFDEVAGASGADPALVERATLAAGEMYDTLGERQKAIQRYRRVILDTADERESKIAFQHLRHPYHYPEASSRK